MAVNLGVLQEFAGFHARSEFWLRQELVILAFGFRRTCRARGARNRVNKLGRFAKRIDQRRFAGARWRGKDKQNSVTAESTTQGFGSARGFFPTRPCKEPRVAKSRRHSPWRQAYSIREKFPG